MANTRVAAAATAAKEKSRTNASSLVRRTSTDRPIKRVRKPCSVNKCTNYAQTGGVCIRHGAKQKRCSREECTNRAIKGGVCVRHGAKQKRKLCSNEGCKNQAINGGVCWRHGAKYNGCNGESQPREDTAETKGKSSVSKDHASKRKREYLEQDQLGGEEVVQTKHRYEHSVYGFANDEDHSTDAQGQHDDSNDSSSEESSDDSSSDDDDSAEFDARESQEHEGSESGESNEVASDAINASYEQLDNDADDAPEETDCYAGVDSEEDDEDIVIEATEQFHKSKIRQSKLYMTIQGFQMQRNNQSRDRGMSGTATDCNCVVFDPDVVEFEAHSFHKNKCYTLKGKGTTVGIKRFISTDTALCILVVSFKRTILGEEGSDLMKDEFVQVFNCEKEVSLSDLETSDKVDEIPSLIYQAQTPGKWHSFGYFYERTRARTLRKREHIQSLELFAGAGGSLQG